MNKEQFSGYKEKNQLTAPGMGQKVEFGTAMGIFTEVSFLFNFYLI
ncbi:MAG: hypothetical protein MJ252_11515 [archaeon]|nr:hypothetical protein [archaeon]